MTSGNSGAPLPGSVWKRTDNVILLRGFAALQEQRRTAFTKSPCGRYESCNCQLAPHASRLPFMIVHGPTVSGGPGRADCHAAGHCSCQSQAIVQRPSGGDESIRRPSAHASTRPSRTRRSVAPAQQAAAEPHVLDRIITDHMDRFRKFRLEQLQQLLAREFWRRSPVLGHHPSPSLSSECPSVG